MRATSLDVIPSPDEDHTQNYDADPDNTNDNTYNKVHFIHVTKHETIEVSK